jgi:Zn-dependent protease with chaperone function
MRVAVYVPLLVPVLAALAAWPLARRLPPAVATWLLTALSLALALASVTVLAMLAASALIAAPAVASLGHLSAAVFSAGDAVPRPVAVAAGALLALAAVAAGRALWQRVTAIAAAHRQARSLPGTGPVVVTDDPAADAYTIPGWPCRVVITQGMLDALSGAERQVLLAHEHAHARGSHYLFTSAARLAAAANPLLRPLAAAVGYAAERWADERAAAQAGDRALAARAIARAALAATAAPPRRDAALEALGVLGAGHRGPGPVPRRVAALLAPPPGPAWLLLGAGVALAALSAAGALEAAVDLHQLIEFAQAARG